MTDTPKLPFRLLGRSRIFNNNGWVADAAENRVDFVITACNYHERLRDQLQAVVRNATEQELANAVQLLAELAKEVQP